MKTIYRKDVPKCDLCEKQDDHVTDAKTRMGPWAYMCDACLQDNGVMVNIGTRIEKAKGE